jgi:hypothetical protein
MDQSVSVNESVSASGSVGTGNDQMNTSIEGYIGVDMSAEAHVSVGASGLNAGAEYREVAQASVTAEGAIQQDGIGGVSGSATVYVKTGTELEGHVVAGDRGLDVGAGASIGTAAGVDAEISCSDRYTSTTVGTGVSIGEHFEVGGSAQATYEHGVVTVGVGGDVAALVGLDVDVAISVDTKQIVSDVEKAVPVVEKTANTTLHAVDNATKTTTNAISNGANSTTKSVKKAFKKIKL